MSPSPDAPERVLVVGADAGGMSAAHQALRVARRHGRDLAVTVLDAGGHTSYSACGIPYVVSGEVAGTDDLVARTAAEHRAAGIDLRLGVRVTRLDLERKVAEVLVDGVPGEPVPFDQVVVASGARPVVPDWAVDADGRPYAGVAPAKTLDDAAAWRDRFTAAEPGSRVVVAGGGYIGVEMAEAALRRGLAATMVTRSRVMSAFTPAMGERVAEGLRAAGVEVLTHAEVVGLDVADGAVRGVRTADALVPCEHVVVALGVTPATDFLDHTDLLSERGALQPDERGRVAPGVWAAGDCCEVLTHEGFRTYAPLGTYAVKAGRVVGENLAGGDLRLPGMLGSAVTRFAYGDVHLEIARTGQLRRQRVDVNAEPVSLLTEGTTATGYMPEAHPIAILVTADAVSRRLLAVEVVGGPGAGKRVDAAAAVLHLDGTVDDLAWMDLSYAPPVATAWEVLQIAARRLAERL